jgi:hypothetical protein
MLALDMFSLGSLKGAEHSALQRKMSLQMLHTAPKLSAYPETYEGVKVLRIIDRLKDEEQGRSLGNILVTPL